MFQDRAVLYQQLKLFVQRRQGRRDKRSLVKMSLVIIPMFLLASVLVGTFVQRQFASAAGCKAGDMTYNVVSGDTLANIAARYTTNWQTLASYNGIGNANMIYAGQMLCIPGHGSAGSGQTGGGSGHPVYGTGNYFPLYQCTWGAANLHYSYTGHYVPWTINSNAWQWVDRAREFGWHVYTTPHHLGDIVVLQPWVQGAYDLGHVAVVTHINGDGSVLAANMNWGIWQGQDVYVFVQFKLGIGVAFVSEY